MRQIRQASPAGRPTALASTLIFAFALVSAPLPGSPAQPVFEIKQATIVAFFVRADRTDLTDAESNQTLADFQYYARQVHEPLEKDGISLRETYSPSFRVKVNGESIEFRPGEIKIGYYLVAPGRKPQVEYGVRTDHDLLQIAHRYFAASK